MNFAQERSSIEARFTTQWAGRTPIAFDNVAFTPPANQGAFVRLAIRNGDSNTAGVQGTGSVLTEHQGRIWVQVFVKEGTGTAAARGHADAAAAIFGNSRFDGIRCYAPEIKHVGADGNGYHQINVSIPYRRFQ